MTKTLPSLTLGLLLALSLNAAGGSVTNPRKLSDGAQFAVDGGTLRVEFWSPEIVRVTYVTGADNPAVTTITSKSDSDANSKTLRWSSEAGKAIDYYFCYATAPLIQP